MFMLSAPVLPGYRSQGVFYFWSLFEVAMAERWLEIPCHLLKINPAHLMINSQTTSDDDIERARKDLSLIFTHTHIYNF